MIISQERAFLKAHTQLQAICRFVERSASDGRRIDQTERELFAQLLAVGRTLLEAFVAPQRNGDAGSELKRRINCSIALDFARGVKIKRRRSTCDPTCLRASSPMYWKTGCNVYA